MAGWVKRLKKGVRKEVSDPRLEELGYTKDGVCVYLVDGPVVRRDIDIDFTEGGHGAVYGYIPKKEVWIEKEESEEERNFLLLHELHEYRLMTDEGLEYEEAHQRASAIEQDCRRNPKKLAGALKEEGWTG
jgi:hypothetical protein